MILNKKKISILSKIMKERNAEPMEQDQGGMNEFKRIQRVKNKIDVYQSA